jgi:hypothetical protein
LQIEVLQYLDYYYRKKKDFNQKKEFDVLKSLNKDLKEKLMRDANKIILKESQILKENFSEKVISKLIPYIQQINLTPEEPIYKVNEDIFDEDLSLYFIQKG